ncbi:MAG: hypothetical protein JSW28_07540 [Thermoplasmata archaeon]|nr:MAG: hypothetical protein JSW28_07540 [Thermoplasmata archaeon]
MDRLLIYRVVRGKHHQGILSILFLIILLIFPKAVAGTPELKVAGVDRAPGIIYMGLAHEDELTDIPMLYITLRTFHPDGVTVTSMVFHMSGLAPDSAVDALHLYNDSDGDGNLIKGVDEHIGSSQFTLGLADFTVSLRITSEQPALLFVVMNVSADAKDGLTVGLDIPHSGFITTAGNAIIKFTRTVASKKAVLTLDNDGDLSPDAKDPDDDNDGYTDLLETRCQTDSLDAASVPEDHDGDYVPDAMDADDDNDGTPDIHDDFPLDSKRQRDYTPIYIYAVLAAVLIVVMVVLGRPRKLKKVKVPEQEGEDEFSDEMLDELLDGDF